MRGESIIIDVEDISRKTAENEYVMLGMRLAEGVDVTDFKRRFGRELLEAFQTVSKYAPEYITLGENRVAFTEKGMMVSNFILSDILDFE